MRAQIVALVALVALVLAGACKPKPAPQAPGDAGPVGDAAAADAAVADASPWQRLAELPTVDPIRVITVPSRPDLPRFDVGGPAVVGDVAVVSSSQFGFAAIDWRHGAVAWTRPAGHHVAPPLGRDGSAILIGDCLNPPAVADTLLGCLRVVTAGGADQSYAAIHGKRVEGFAAAPGVQEVWLDGERTVRWRRGDRAVAVDLFTAVATPAPAESRPVHVVYGKRTWDVTRTEQHIIAREHGKLAWQTRRAYSDLIGAVYLADSAPALRITRIGAFAGLPELSVLDIDATGSMNGQVAFPVPAISTFGHAIDAVGNTAIAVRIDSSLRHDFIAGYAATAQLMYVYPLPEAPRADPIGLAVAPDAVLVFHDGDTFTVLPELSAPPTAPGAPVVPSQNPTP